MSAQLLQLRQHVAAILPLLGDNLGLAYKDYMAGTLARGAYEYCRTRHDSALTIISSDIEQLDEDKALRVAATFFLDLRTALKDVPSCAQPAEQAKVDAMWAFFIECGFTQVSPLFDIPIKAHPAETMPQEQVTEPA